MSPQYQVYWAPGCSSCLRTKEFLLQHDVPFESVNVVEHSQALDDLATLGFRSVPVLRRGNEAVYCQDLQDVANFLGVTLENSDLTQADLVNKCALIIRAAQRYIRQLSEEQLSGHFPGRDRSYRDLAFHIFMVIEGFLEAARGGSLEMEMFLRTPPTDACDRDALVATGDGVRDALLSFYDDRAPLPPELVKTYYGERSTLSVLERTTWHAAQHCRQLQAVVEGCGLRPDGPLGDPELGGLPLPDDIYDNEIPMQT